MFSEKPISCANRPHKRGDCRYDPARDERSGIDRILALVPLAIIIVYQHTLSHLIGNQCRFYPSCSVYGRQAFQQKPFFQACWLTIKRIAKCNPLHPGGYDPLNPDAETNPSSLSEEER